MAEERVLTWSEIRREVERHLSPDDLPDPEESVDRQLYLKALLEMLELFEERQLRRTHMEFLLAAVFANLLNVQTTRGSIACQTFLASLWQPNGAAHFIDGIVETMDEAAAAEWDRD